MIEEIRMFLAEQLLGLAVWLAPDTKDGNRLLWSIYDYFRDCEKEL